MPKRGERALRKYLDAVFGNDSRGLIDELAAIAKGERTIEEQYVDATGQMKVETSGASYSDRIAAIKILLEYHQGKPEKTVNHNVRQAPVKWNPDKLTLEQLEEMARMLKQAAVKELEEGEIVDGELKSEDDDSDGGEE